LRAFATTKRRRPGELPQQTSPIVRIEILKDIPSNPVKDSREKPGSLIRAPCVPAATTISISSGAIFNLVVSS
jgi:hypothetical protein